MLCSHNTSASLSPSAGRSLAQSWPRRRQPARTSGRPASSAAYSSWLLLCVLGFSSSEWSVRKRWGRKRASGGSLYPAAPHPLPPPPSVSSPLLLLAFASQKLSGLHLLAMQITAVTQLARVDGRGGDEEGGMREGRKERGEWGT